MCGFAVKVVSMQRLWRAIRWLGGTSWPLYTAAVLGTNLLAAVGVIAFLEFLLPLSVIDPDIIPLQVSGTVLGVGVAYIAVAAIISIATSFALFRPVLDWQRHPDRHDPNMVRNLVMRIPFYQTVLTSLVWVVGIAIITGFATRGSSTLAITVGVTTSLGGAMAAMVTYLEAERLVRPVAALVLARRFEVNLVVDFRGTDRRGFVIGVGTLHPVLSRVVSTVIASNRGVVSHVASVGVYWHHAGGHERGGPDHRIAACYLSGAPGRNGCCGGHLRWRGAGGVAGWF